MATLVAAVIALLVASGAVDWLRAPRLSLTFDQREPWCRAAQLVDGSQALWVRVGVENVGRQPARGCVGRMTSIASDGQSRPDIDPLQLRWAGLPRSQAFAPIDVRPQQREFLNVLLLPERSRWQMVTFDDHDFDPGFSTELSADREHVLRIAVFSDNAAIAGASLVARVGEHDSIVLRLRDTWGR